jgi:hypothetical protein
MDQGPHLLRAKEALNDSFDHLKNALKKKGLPSPDSLQNPESREIDATTAVDCVDTRSKSLRITL